jgi:aspartate/methionine/tyrosine aminotransferase
MPPDELTVCAGGSMFCDSLCKRLLHGQLICAMHMLSALLPVKVAGLVPTYIPCDKHTWLPDWSQVSAADAQRCTCLLLNYPNNPTGVVVDQEFWQKVLRFCEKHDLLLIHDNPYQSQVSGWEAAVTAAGLAQSV